MIYISADSHGEYENFLNRTYRLKSGDTVIICGDFGFVKDESIYRILLSRLSREPFTIAFADGNHDDMSVLSQYEQVEWNGGQTHKIADNIYHLMRGQRFVIEGKSFFVMGGAYSHDRSTSLEQRDWQSELPCREEYDTAERTLKEYGYSADYIITHALPRSVMKSQKLPFYDEETELTEYLDCLYRDMSFKYWFAGHYHFDREVGKKIRLVYDELVGI